MSYAADTENHKLTLPSISILQYLLLHIRSKEKVLTECDTKRF